VKKNPFLYIYFILLFFRELPGPFTRRPTFWDPLLLLTRYLSPRPFFFFCLPCRLPSLILFPPSSLEARPPRSVGFPFFSLPFARSLTPGAFGRTGPNQSYLRLLDKGRFASPSFPHSLTPLPSPFRAGLSSTKSCFSSPFNRIPRYATLSLSFFFSF